MPASGPCWPLSARAATWWCRGRPGTGKSQTIANAIAETLARGKTVLFVSEKLAALQVVAKRLRAAGLGDFCLEAHGHGGDKAAMVAALAAALPGDRPAAAIRHGRRSEVLAERRAALNAYARALHDAAQPARGLGVRDPRRAWRSGPQRPAVIFDLPVHRRADGRAARSG